MKYLSVLLAYEKYLPVLTPSEVDGLLASRPSLAQLQDWSQRFTLSVGEPDNAAAKTGAGTAFGVNGDHEQGLCLFTRFALQNFQRALRFDF